MSKKAHHAYLKSILDKKLDAFSSYHYKSFDHIYNEMKLALEIVKILGENKASYEIQIYDKLQQNPYPLTTMLEHNKGTETCCLIAAIISPLLAIILALSLALALYTSDTISPADLVIGVTAAGFLPFGAFISTYLVRRCRRLSFLERLESCYTDPVKPIGRDQVVPVSSPESRKKGPPSISIVRKFSISRTQREEKMGVII